jgi:23S rRNA pseudouridine1911/1915/1917 synthase
MTKQLAKTYFRVNEQTARQTLAAALRHWLPGKSWGEARGLVSGRRVQVNGNLCVDAARRLAEGDVVHIYPQAFPKPPKAELLKIRYLDEHLVVVEKPPGVTTVRHPEERDWPAARKQLQPTLEEMLPKAIDREEGRGRERRQDRDRKQKGHKRRQRRVRPVHRLDRDTSGLMVFARTVEAERALMAQFKNHTIQRKYRAILVGRLERPRTIQSILVRDRGDGRRGSATSPNVPGKPAITHVRPIEKLAGFTLVECRLETGRTHQIRIHLAEAGHPVCGEKVYQKPLRGRAIADKSGAARIMLHAAELGFVHPMTEAALHFSMPLPADMFALWKRLKHPASSPS